MPAFLQPIREIWSSRGLLRNLVRRDLTVRYRHTALGFFWSLAKPLALMAIYHVVFTMVLPVPTTEPRIPYALHILTGLLPWTFFMAAGSEALQSILASANLVKKVKLPLEVFPLAAVCSQAFHFGLAMTATTAATVLFGLAPGPAVLLVPAIAAIQFVLVLAVALLLSSLNVFYRDTASIWEVVAVGWFFATPIVYPVGAATALFAERGWRWAEWLYLANPMTPLVAAYRRCILYGALENPIKEMSDARLALALAAVAALSALLLFAAHRVFARLSRRFADVV